MHEWLLIPFLLGCGWNCDTRSLPIFPPFETWEDCEKTLQYWIEHGEVKPMARDIFGPGVDYKYAGRRGGKCVERERED